MYFRLIEDALLVKKKKYDWQLIYFIFSYILALFVLLCRFLNNEQEHLFFENKNFKNVNVTSVKDYWSTDSSKNPNKYCFSSFSSLILRVFTSLDVNYNLFVLWQRTCRNNCRNAFVFLQHLPKCRLFADGLERDRPSLPLFPSACHKR